MILFRRRPDSRSPLHGSLRGIRAQGAVPRRRQILLLHMPTRVRHHDKRSQQTIPAAWSAARYRRHLRGPLLEQQRGRLLRRIVVVVANLRLAILERPIPRQAWGEEQIGVGMARHLQIGPQQALEALVAGHALPLLAHGFLQPQLRCRGELTFHANDIAARQQLGAVADILPASLWRDRKTREHVAGRGAELAGGQHIPASLGDVVLGADGSHLDTGAPHTQRRHDGQQEAPDGASLPAKYSPTCPGLRRQCVVCHVVSFP